MSIPCLFKSQIYTIPSLRSSKVLKQALEQLQPDLVHASLTLSPLDFLLPEICEELGVPLVATFHPAFDQKLRNISSGTQHLTYQLYAPALARYDRTIVFSNLQQELLIRLGVAPERVAVIPNGVDIERYCPGPAALPPELTGKRLFVYLGRLAAEKNVEALLKGWKLAEMGPDCQLLIVGDGTLRTLLESSYGPELGVIWWGFEGDEQRRIDFLRAAEAFILPSFVEGLSLSLLEAMACGTPCLATDAGADGEVLADGAGIVLNPARVAAQLQTLLPLLRDHPEMRDILGRKARQRVLERYTLRDNITQVEHLYAQLRPDLPRPGATLQAAAPV